MALLKKLLGSVRPKRWWPSFSLRWLLVMITGVALVLGYFSHIWRRAQHQRAIVAKIQAEGGHVEYHYQFGMGKDLDALFDVETASTTTYGLTPDGRRKRTHATPTGDIYEVETPPGPKIIRWLLGDDIYAHVECVQFGREAEPPLDFDTQLLRELPHLKVVWLSDHQVNDQSLAHVAQLPQLRVLNLLGDTGTATSQGIAQLQDAHHLELLGLMGDWVQYKTLTGIAPLHQLKGLQIIDAPNAAVLFPNLEKLSNLRQLFVARAPRIDDGGSESLAGLTEMKDLVLAGTSVSDDTLLHVSNLVALERLDLSHTNITDQGLIHLARLRRLRSLNLGSTKVTDAGLSSLSHLNELEWLQLWPAAITDDGLEALRPLSSLTLLSVGPDITKAGADRLRLALPSCEVRRFNAEGHSSFPDNE